MTTPNVMRSNPGHWIIPLLDSTATNGVPGSLQSLRSGPTTSPEIRNACDQQAGDPVLRDGGRSHQHGEPGRLLRPRADVVGVVARMALHARAGGRLAEPAEQDAHGRVRASSSSTGWRPTNCRIPSSRGFRNRCTAPPDGTGRCGTILATERPAAASVIDPDQRHHGRTGAMILPRRTWEDGHADRGCDHRWCHCHRLRDVRGYVGVGGLVYKQSDRSSPGCSRPARERSTPDRERGAGGLIRAGRRQRDLLPGFAAAERAVVLFAELQGCEQAGRAASRGRTRIALLQSRSTYASQRLRRR